MRISVRCLSRLAKRTVISAPCAKKFLSGLNRRIFSDSAIGKDAWDGYFAGSCDTYRQDYNDEGVMQGDVRGYFTEWQEGSGKTPWIQFHWPCGPPISKFRP